MKSAAENHREVVEIIAAAGDRTILANEITDYILKERNEAILVGQSCAPGATFDAHARDAFARAALTGLLSTGHSDDQVSLVEEAFEIADQCLVERMKARPA